MKNKIILAFIFLVAGSTFISATPQIPDILIYEGKEYGIDSSFLEEYFKKFPERNPKPDDFECSALWKGYHATFAVANDRIYLKDVAINFCFGPSTSVLKTVVPSGETLYIDWVSELSISGYGENDADPYSYEYEDAHEKYSLFEIDKGNLTEVRHFDNKGYRLFKKKQFKAYKKTKEYDSRLKAMLEKDPKMNKAKADADIESSMHYIAKTFLVK